MGRTFCTFCTFYIALASEFAIILMFLLSSIMCSESHYMVKQAHLMGPFIRITSGERIILRSEFQSNAMHSQKIRFSFGFFKDSAGFFTVAIYASSYDKPRRVWAASGDGRIALKVADNATLQLDSGGNLVLLDSCLQQIWSTNTSGSGAVRLELQQSGNLVLYDKQDKHVWQSFDSPLDVLLPGQKLRMGMKMVNGKFSLLAEHGGLVLYSGIFRKWMWSFYGMRAKRSLSQNCKHLLSIEFRTDGIHLAKYSTTSQTIARELCNFSTIAENPLRLMKGYVASAMRLSEDGTIHVDVQSAEDKFLRRFRSRYLLAMEHNNCISPWHCEYCNKCIDGHDCICSSNSARYKGLQSWAPILKRGPQDIYPAEKKRITITILEALVSAACVALLLSVCATKKPQNSRFVVTNKSVQEALRDSLPEEFSFRTLRKITNNFSSKLGDGGFGLVYEGLFKGKTKVAVKVLDRTSTQGEKEFRAEVTMMASTRHMHVMHLRGFCAEKAHRLLVYDYMPNASLDKWLFSPSGRFTMLDWVTRFNIARGAARGLAYLHEECTQQIIHLDVKPENILLDENFVPKVADFGLSKLIDRDRSRVVTNTRGTPGYLAPEWVQRSSVTAKVDVYSFGIVLLELVCGRETIDMSMGSELWYLPAWAVRMVEEGRALEIIDSHIREEVQLFFEEQGKRVIRVALCCIQEDPAVRPAMSRVVQMLEGTVDPKAPSVTRVSTQPTAVRLKGKLKAYVEAMSDGYTHDVTMGSNLRGLDNGTIGKQTGHEDVGILVASGHAVLKPKTGPTIPPWPLKGYVVLVRGVGDKNLHAVIRDVRVRLKQVKFAFLCRLEDTESSERWGVEEEETIWRQWNVMVRTMEFWIPVKWSTLPMCGSENFPIEWLVK
ncbi:hypothetical protein O6H91_17G017800 [Diphasiastrum complanatum]|uniref:Uncharacterized protein n=5 Tax=Diphasiastrum complanatum TaxID=34168 RepID=A0ACC2B4J4_DIPCM|nr:hypothetical protein O6H91_17G017800 [Diphasiastrum complanatum]KAJ7524711.1 hypothetical protein O6H91_17G017800 [Diphasiastrum complanatum]KAJ7524712.1 hypothetical protein O6H91_17G017800 [Diphasiastrum complanatum]KAJ7524713.1 hypothetical protein O6H91_17G017800 [Diphasiastrum complanatum]KAJ7524714.1 hypothetical protein O6H91_17G017800 [Diphasiastrum complanatum]